MIDEYDVDEVVDEAEHNVVVREKFVIDDVVVFTAQTQCVCIIENDDDEVVDDTEKVVDENDDVYMQGLVVWILDDILDETDEMVEYGENDEIDEMCVRYLLIVFAPAPHIQILVEESGDDVDEMVIVDETDETLELH